MKVEYYTRQVYGKTVIYLVVSAVSNAILGLIQQKTINVVQMDQCEKLGIVFERVFDPSIE